MFQSSQVIGVVTRRPPPRAQAICFLHCTARFGGPLRIVIAEASVQLRKSLFQQGNIFRVRLREPPQIVLVNVRDLARLNAFEELDQPVALLMPILRAHDRLHTSR